MSNASTQLSDEALAKRLQDMELSAQRKRNEDQERQDAEMARQERFPQCPEIE